MSGVQRASDLRRGPAAVLPGPPATRGKTILSWVSPRGGGVHSAALKPTSSLTQLDQAALGSHFQQKWFELQKLLERQKSKGGIIDPEEEAKRFLIHTNEVRGRRLASRTRASLLFVWIVPLNDAGHLFIPEVCEHYNLLLKLI